MEAYRFGLFCGRAFPLALLALLAARVGTISAAVLYESGSLGPTGLARGEAPGANVSPVVFNGVRFELTQPVITEQIGGHFVGSPGTTGTLFGAIVALENANDFPDSGDLSTADVLGTTVLAFPAPSAEIFSDLSLSLTPGWYALVFGSGLFGAAGDGAMPLNNPDIDMPSYIGFQPGAVLGWGNLINPIFRNYRFIVEGQIVPEPASITLLMGLFLVFGTMRALHR